MRKTGFHAENVQYNKELKELWHFEKIGTCHYSLIGRHLESIGRTEPIFELILAPSEERPTYEIRSNSGIFDRVIMLTL